MQEILFSATLVLSIAYAVFISWCIIGWLKTENFLPENRELNQKCFVSVIIPARNEAENIIACLSDFLQQDYPPEFFEVIVADDHSEDDTAKLAQQFITDHPGIQVRLLKMENKNVTSLFKKQAITNAIGIAKGELIITTDADTRRGARWIQALAGCYLQSKAVLVSGPVLFESEKGWLEKIQSLEFLGLIAIGAAAISNKKPFLCNGANLSFSKRAFSAVGGYGSSKSISSGDDTLLMQKIAAFGAEKVVFVKSQTAVVTTRPQSSMVAFLNQRKRWASKIPVQMGPFTLFIAILAYLLHAGLLINAFVSLQGANVLHSVLPLLIKMTPEFVLLFLASSYFGKRTLLFLFLPAQIIYPVYITVVGLASLSGNYQWKGRNVS